MFVKPVSEALGISRSRFSLTTTFVSVASMLMSLVVSRLYRRFTIKRVMLAWLGRTLCHFFPLPLSHRIFRAIVSIAQEKRSVNASGAGSTGGLPSSG